MPRYLEIKQEILEQIKTKEVNTSIPSERELSLLFDASRMTIRKAIDELVEEGVLYRDKNKGTFIADHTFVNRNSSKEILLEQDVDDYISSFQISCVRHRNTFLCECNSRLCAAYHILTHVTTNKVLMFI